MSASISILVVDDNPDMATVMADILGAKGFQVHAATSGTEALDFMKEHPVNILLTGINSHPPQKSRCLVR
jgi:CheY-like chemotaxis protein